MQYLWQRKTYVTKAQDDYVMIYTPSGKHLKKNMKYFETHCQFVRVHHSYIVYVDYIVQIEYFSKETLAILKNGAKLKISDSGYKLLRERLNF